MLCSLPQRLLSPFSCLSQYFSLSLHFSAEGHLCRARGASAGATAKHSHALRSLGAGRSSRDPTMSCPRDRELPKGFPSPELFSLDKATWSIPRSLHSSCRVQCTCGFWEDQDHSRETPTSSMKSPRSSDAGRTPLPPPLGPSLGHWQDPALQLHLLSPCQLQRGLSLSNVPSNTESTI